MVLRWLLCLLATISPFATRATVANDGGVVEFEFFRAMPQIGIGKWPMQNFNLASSAGVIKYVHTEVIAEHIIGDTERSERKYGVDAVARLRFKVRNPGGVLNPDNHLVTQVDFGPFVTYDSGVATNPATQEYIKDFGGYVGVQLQKDQRWPYLAPYFWFSVTGFCPNMRYDQIPMTREQYEEAVRESTICATLNSSGDCNRRSDVCEFVDGACKAADIAHQCIDYSEKSGLSGKVLGGLCPGGKGNDSVIPTGEPGCTYSYGRAEMVILDDVVGLHREDCGGRPCTSWLDFRHHCTNATYKQKFDPASNSVVPFKYCVEYDIHPLCEADCSSKACLALPESEKELGVPFWRGKCEAEFNEQRVAAFESGPFVLSSSSDDGDDTIEIRSAAEDGGNQTCVHQAPGVCAPSAGGGGNYCTREWAGVCANCFVPGTSARWPATDMPYCPYDVLRRPDYAAGRFPPPQCASERPRDRCCLYLGSCAVAATSAEDAPLDEDGFALVASWGNASALAAFLARAAEKDGLRLVEGGNLTAFADAAVDIAPVKGASLSQSLGNLLLRELVVDVRTTTTREVRSSTTEVPKVPVVAASASTTTGPDAAVTTTTTTTTPGSSPEIQVGVDDSGGASHAGGTIERFWPVAVIAGGLLIVSGLGMLCRRCRMSKRSHHYDSHVSPVSSCSGKDNTAKPMADAAPGGVSVGGDARMDLEAQTNAATPKAIGAEKDEEDSTEAQDLPRLGLIGRTVPMGAHGGLAGFFDKLASSPFSARKVGKAAGDDDFVQDMEAQSEGAPEGQAAPFEESPPQQPLRTGDFSSGSFFFSGAVARLVAVESSAVVDIEGRPAAQESAKASDEAASVAPKVADSSEEVGDADVSTGQACSASSTGSSDFDSVSSTAYSDYDTVGYVKI